MVRRYLDNKTKERYKRLSRFDDEPKHVTETGPKIPEFDEAIDATRMLYIQDIKEAPLDVDDILTMKIMELVNAARETRQFVEQTNDYLNKQTLKISELKNLHKTFVTQVKTLGEKQDDV